jgi:ribonuclease E
MVEEEPAAAEEKPTRKPRAKKKPEDAPLESKPAAKAPAVVPEPSNEDAPGEPRRGWWQRTFG